MRAATVYKVSPTYLTMQSDDDRYPRSPEDDVGMSRSLQDQYDMLSAALKLSRMARERSFTPLSPDDKTRLTFAALDVVFDVGARPILDSSGTEDAYCKMIERARSQ